MSCTKKTIIFLLSFILFQTSYAITIEKLKEHPPYKEYIEKLEQLKIKNRVMFFKYDSEFAKAGNLDVKKAIKLPENMHGVGISVLEFKKGSDNKFPRYDCRVHFILKNKDDYWLPKDSYGSWDDIRSIGDEIQELTGAKNVMFWNSRKNYSMRTFIAPSIQNPKPDSIVRISSVIPMKYMKDIYPNMTYIEFDVGCSIVPSISKKPSIWIEKKGGPDFTIDRINSFYKFFYEFPIIDEVFNDACPYIQKVKTYSNWNFHVTSSFNKSNKPEDYELKNPEQVYTCSINKTIE